METRLTHHYICPLVLLLVLISLHRRISLQEKRLQFPQMNTESMMMMMMMIALMSFSRECFLDTSQLRALMLVVDICLSPNCQNH